MFVHAGNTFKTNNYCYCIQNCAYTSESEQINLICGDSGWRIKNLCIMKCDGIGLNFNNIIVPL